jgi:hypothetical protein
MSNGDFPATPGDLRCHRLSRIQAMLLREMIELALAERS